MAETPKEYLILNARKTESTQNSVYLTLMRLFKAEHIGVRKYREKLSEKIDAGEPIILTFNGAPKQVVMPYEQMIQLLESMLVMEQEIAKEALR